MCGKERVQLTPAIPELDWCHPFLCGDTVDIAGSMYHVTVLLDTGIQQSLCSNVTGRKVMSSNAVLRRIINTVKESVTAKVKLQCPLVTTTAMTDDLPVAGVDRLLGNGLTGGRVWVPHLLVVILVRSFSQWRQTLSGLSAGRRPEG